jgi:hypothetical protein
MRGGGGGAKKGTEKVRHILILTPHTPHPVSVKPYITYTVKPRTALSGEIPQGGESNEYLTPARRKA